MIWSFIARRSLWPGSFLMSCLAGLAPAQCTNPWPHVLGAAGVEGTVSSMVVFDPDGAGPVGERVLVAGDFYVAGEVLATNLAIYDPAMRTWAPFGPGPYPANLQLGRAISGDLYVAGDFTSIGGVAASRVARWDGSSWSPLGLGITGSYAPRVRVLPSGVVVFGQITAAGGQPTAGIARWDGNAWSSLLSPSLGNVDFLDVVEMPNGDLYAAVQSYATWPFYGWVLRFDGTGWSPVGMGFLSPPSALAVLPSGELVAGGGAGAGAEQVVRWDGFAWASLPNAPFTSITELSVLPGGTLIAIGRRNSTSDARIATWDGVIWTQLGDTRGYLAAIEVLANGELLIAGSFGAVDLIPAGQVARWNGSAWASASSGLTGTIRHLAVRSDGSIFVGAGFGGAGEALVQRWNGLSWQRVGGSFAVGGIDTTNMTCLFAAANGDLLASGQLGSGAPALPILQRWSGASWAPVATAAWGSIASIVELANGDLVVGGQFAAIDGVTANNVARLDGANWTPMGGGVPGAVVQLVASPAGELFALSNAVYRWNGTNWTQLGLAPGGMLTSLVLPADGMPVVGGNLPGVDVLRWNGTVWGPVGAGPGGPVKSLAVLPDGDLVAGPVVDPINPARPLRRWNGSAWQALGGDVDGTVHAIASAGNGDLLLCGDFAVADGVPRARFARVTTTCPASVTSYASSCGSAPTLVADRLPWLGGTCRTTAVGVPAGVLALVVFGTAPTSVPIGWLVPWPTGYPCNLLVWPDVVVGALPTGGAVRTQFAVPDSTALLGASVRQQVLTVQFDAVGAVTSVLTSNALALQVGSF